MCACEHAEKEPHYAPVKRPLNEYLCTGTGPTQWATTYCHGHLLSRQSWHRWHRERRQMRWASTLRRNMAVPMPSTASPTQGPGHIFVGCRVAAIGNRLLDPSSVVVGAVDPLRCGACTSTRSQLLCLKSIPTCVSTLIQSNAQYTLAVNSLNPIKFTGSVPHNTVQVPGSRG
eukprot:m.823919 g.823919  ORF g.823919 m.823919 type:complete len:173 (+) comp23405_c0_seq19:1051-1569(+)